MESARMRAFRLLREALGEIQATKPGDRSEIDRRYAIVITMIEKAIAYFGYYIMREDE
jgi:hypothetical protein